jgi:hypothetical protein
MTCFVGLIISQATATVIIDSRFISRCCNKYGAIWCRLPFDDKGMWFQHCRWRRGGELLKVINPTFLWGNERNPQIYQSIVYFQIMNAYFTNLHLTSTDVARIENSRLLPRCKSDIHSSQVLHNLDWWSDTDVLGQRWELSINLRCVTSQKSENFILNTCNAATFEMICCLEGYSCQEGYWHTSALNVLQISV